MKKRTKKDFSNKAVISFVSAIIGFIFLVPPLIFIFKWYYLTIIFFISSAISIVFGILGLKQIKNNKLKGTSLATLGIVLGVFLFLTAILFALIVPNIFAS